jgi:osmoprotectant transport system permease protein
MAGCARFRVELPLAMPVIFAGLRVVTVSNIALVSVAVLIGSGRSASSSTLALGASSTRRSLSVWC